MINIEMSILCSVLENGFLGADEKILNKRLNADYFNSQNHKLFVNSINRLREINEPIDSDTLRLKLMSVNKWNFFLEDDLLKIMTANPFGSYEMFMSYYDVLEKNYTDSHKFRQIRDI